MTRRRHPAARVALGLLSLGLVVAAPPALAERVHRYVVSVTPELDRIQVGACFAGRPPALLAAESDAAPGAYIGGRYAATPSRRLAPSGGELPLKDLPDDACIDYSVDLNGARLIRDQEGNANRWTGKDLVTDLGLWFWRPVKLAEDEAVEVAFRLPEGMSVSTPWLPAVGGEPDTYRVGRGRYSRNAEVVFGRFREFAIEVPGARLRVAVLNGRPPADEAAMRVWIEDAARSVAAVYGRFPVSDAQVVVMPGAPAREPTPWAYVLRGDRASVHFSVNQRRPLREYVEDWTAPHELSHLLLPDTGTSDAWLSEGIATYYQNVTRARSGALTPEEAWQNIHAGFRRGRKLDTKNLTLAQATQRMFRDNAYMRVYWQGAAIVLAADVRLRRDSGGRQSLDSVLADFADCCLDPEREWTARQVFEHFDRISGTRIFTTLLDAQIDTPGFPDLSDLYRELGLEALGGKVELRADAPLAAIREAIMAPGPYRTPAALLR